MDGFVLTDFAASIPGEGHHVGTAWALTQALIVCVCLIEGQACQSFCDTAPFGSMQGSLTKSWHNNDHFCAVEHLWFDRRLILLCLLNEKADSSFFFLFFSLFCALNVTFSYKVKEGEVFLRWKWTDRAGVQPWFLYGKSFCSEIKNGTKKKLLHNLLSLYKCLQGENNIYTSIQTKSVMCSCLIYLQTQPNLPLSSKERFLLSACLGLYRLQSDLNIKRTYFIKSQMLLCTVLWQHSTWSNFIIQYFINS